MLTQAVSKKLFKETFKLVQITRPSCHLLHTSNILCKKKRSGPPKVAIVLSGCGYMDGSEITETVSTCIHLCHKGIQPNFYAPDLDLCTPMNHCDKTAEKAPRNALVEGARFTHSGIHDLSECNPCDNAGLIIPGGLGAVRTLSDFASKGCDCILLPDLAKAIKDFNCADKPIGAICISPVLIAKVLEGVKITLGKDSPKDQWPNCGAIESARQMGATVEMRDVKGVTYCKEYKVYSTPAYMDAKASYGEVYDGIGKLVNMMKKVLKA